MNDRRRSFTPWLIALVAVVPLGVAALLVAVFPMAECPQRLHQEEQGGAWGKYRCFRCRDSGRITLLNKWRDGTEAWGAWEGMEVSAVTVQGCVKTNRQRALDIAGIRPGRPMTDRLKRAALQHLWETDSYETVDVRVTVDPKTPGKVVVDLSVREK